MYDFISGLKALRPDLSSTTQSLSVPLDCLRGNSHHSGKNNPLQFLNGGDCLSMEHKVQQMVANLPLDFVAL